MTGDAAQQVKNGNGTKKNFEDKATGAKRQGIAVEMNGSKLEAFYTKENPGNKPTDANYKKDKEGKMKKIDFIHFKSVEREFFCDLINKIFPSGDNPLYTANTTKPVTETKTTQKETPAAEQPLDDDLPF